MCRQNNACTRQAAMGAQSVFSRPSHAITDGLQGLNARRPAQQVRMLCAGIQHTVCVFARNGCVAITPHHCNNRQHSAGGCCSVHVHLCLSWVQHAVWSKALRASLMRISQSPTSACLTLHQTCVYQAPRMYNTPQPVLSAVTRWQLINSTLSTFSFQLPADHCLPTPVLNQDRVGTLSWKGVGPLHKPSHEQNI